MADDGSFAIDGNYNGTAVEFGSCEVLRYLGMEWESFYGSGKDFVGGTKAFPYPLDLGSRRGRWTTSPGGWATSR
jgi:hypothetical protein